MVKQWGLGQSNQKKLTQKEDEHKEEKKGKSSESVQCAMLKACDACADMGQL